MDDDPLVECLDCHRPVPVSCTQGHCDEHHAGSTPRIENPGVRAQRQPTQGRLDTLGVVPAGRIKQMVKDYIWEIETRWMLDEIRKFADEMVPAVDAPAAPRQATLDDGGPA